MVARGIPLVVVFSSVAFAQPKAESVPVVGAKPIFEVKPSAGFIDDVVASTSDRFAYVVADSTTQAALHLRTLGKDDEQIVDISTVTLQPIDLAFVGTGMLVIGTSEGKQVAALVELSTTAKKRAVGSVIYKVGPADHITLITRDGKLRLAVHRAVEKGGVTTHTTELVAAETGKRAVAGKSLVLDASGLDKKLDFRVNHWGDGWTRAFGIKAGEWDKKEDQRAPDLEGTFDLVTGKLDKQKVTDLFDQKRRFGALVDAGGKLDFLRLAADLAGIQLWKGGKSRALELDQPFASYDPKSLQGIVTPDGAGWLALKVDPVNAAAVARQKADPEYLDVFQFTADGKGVRKMRVIAKGIRHRFGIATGNRVWLLERNAGFERGGKSLTLYQLP